MSQKPVITVEDITKIALEERRPGCEKGVLHEDAPVQTAVYRVQPGSGVPTHLHARVYDLFIGVRGNLEIRYEGEHGNGVFVLKPGGFCRIPPGVRHELSNESEQDRRNGFSARASFAGRLRLHAGAVPYN
jgi:mannose-6-phosphate isomerase-like protein (cupin superfamily)